MIEWIALGIIFIVIVLILRPKKQSGNLSQKMSMFDKVKDACCLHR